MKPSGAKGTRLPLIGPGRLAAALLGIAVLWQPNIAAAADGKSGSLTILPVVVPGDAVDHPVPEVAPGGTLVLRGTRPVNLNAGNLNAGNLNTGNANAGNANQPNPGGGPQGIGAVTNGPAAAAYAAPGWDQRFDYSGLDWGPPGPVIGVIGTGR
jgi:hypothetical protein